MAEDAASVLEQFVQDGKENRVFRAESIPNIQYSCKPTS